MEDRRSISSVTDTPPDTSVSAVPSASPASPGPTSEGVPRPHADHPTPPPGTPRTALTNSLPPGEAPSPAALALRLDQLDREVKERFQRTERRMTLMMEETAHRQGLSLRRAVDKMRAEVLKQVEMAVASRVADGGEKASGAIPGEGRPGARRRPAGAKAAQVGVATCTAGTTPARGFVTSDVVGQGPEHPKMSAMANAPCGAAADPWAMGLAHLLGYIPVPPGRFVMGSPPGEPGRGEDERERTVELSRGFWMKATPITQAEFAQVMGFNPAFHTNVGPQAPVERVSFLDAVVFCNRLSQRLGLPEAYRLDDVRGRPGDESFSARVTPPPPDHPGIRLPTEAEWEYACRAPFAMAPPMESGKVVPTLAGASLPTPAASTGEAAPAPSPMEDAASTPVPAPAPSPTEDSTSVPSPAVSTASSPPGEVAPAPSPMGDAISGSAPVPAPAPSPVNAPALNDIAWTEANARPRRSLLMWLFWGAAPLQTWPVAHKQPNAAGLYDMLGQVWEWTGDLYAEPPAEGGTPEAPLRDPQGGRWGESRVAKGGSVFDGPDDCRAARRQRFTPDFRHIALGFRVVRSMPLSVPALAPDADPS